MISTRLLSAVSLALAGSLLAGSASAQQVVLDFEDLYVNGTTLAPLPAGYGGVADWGSWASSDYIDVNYPPASGLVKILSVGGQQSIFFGQDVVFDGANVVTALPFNFDLYYQGALVHSTAILSPNTGGPAVWLASGYTGLVDEMRYVSAVNVHGVDDFTYTVPFTAVQYCPGDGIAPHTPCPFGNNNDGTMGGCDWGDASFPGGGVLTATGTNSIGAADTFLHADGIENNFGLFFEADNMVNGGNGNPLNDGLRCAGGALVRLTSPTMAAGNTASTPAAIQTLGSTAVAGSYKRYQYWFRTPNGPGGQMANLTNGVEILWAP